MIKSYDEIVAIAPEDIALSLSAAKRYRYLSVEKGTNFLQVITLLTNAKIFNNPHRKEWATTTHMHFIYPDE